MTHFICFLPFVLLLASPPATAQDVFSSPSMAQLEQAKQLQLPTDDQLRKTAREQAAKSLDTFRKLEPSYKGLDKVPLVQQAPPAILPQKPGLDLNGLVRQYSAKIRPPATSGKNDLLVFVSLSMPEGSLMRLARQAERAGAVLVLRGLKNNSFKETTAEIGKYEQKGKASWQINPPAFTKFGVKSVPAFVLTKADQALPASADGCADPGAFAAVSGDVSLDFALEAITRSKPGFEAEARHYLDKIRGG